MYKLCIDNKWHCLSILNISYYKSIAKYVCLALQINLPSISMEVHAITIAEPIVNECLFVTEYVWSHKISSYC